MIIKHDTNEHYCNVWDALQKRARALQGACAGNVLNMDIHGAVKVRINRAGIEFLDPVTAVQGALIWSCYHMQKDTWRQ